MWVDSVAAQTGLPGAGLTATLGDSFTLSDQLARRVGHQQSLQDTLGSTGAAPFYVPVNPPELPREYLVTTYVAPGGTVIPVASGGNLQTAINNAQPGDIIELAAGATFVGNYTLPNKTGNAWVVIRTATTDANLPPQGTRITPASVALLSKISSPNAGPALATDAFAHHYRFIGIEFGLQAGVALSYTILALGDSTFSQTAANTPHDFIVDRCYIHGNATGDAIRGIAMNSNRTAVIDSYIDNCKGVGFDTQAICGWNGSGPFKIVNNFLEGAGENFMFGGADPSITNLIPSDIEFRNNHLYKRLSWKIDHPSYGGVHYGVKNIFELKNAQRVLVDGNLFENNWADAQDGFAIVLKVQDQDGGAPWTFTGDVTFTNNTLIHSGGGINLLGRDPYQISTLMARFLFRNNLFIDVFGANWGNTHGRFFQIQETADVTVDHNTFFNDGIVLLPYGGNPPSAPSTSLRFVWINNIGPHNLYGVLGDSTATGNSTINAYLPGCIFTNNILAGGNSANYPPGNFFPSTLDPGVGFVNYGGGDYNLAPASAYNNAGTDGFDLGWLSALPTTQPGQVDGFAFVKTGQPGSTPVMLGLSDSFALSDARAFTLNYKSTPADTLAQSDSVGLLGSAARLVSDAFPTLTDQLNFDAGAPAITRSLSDTMALSDASSAALGGPFAASPSALAPAIYGTFLYGGGPLGGSNSVASGPTLAISDSLTISDAVAVTLNFQPTQGDTLSQSDSVVLVRGDLVPIADSLVFSDAIAAGLSTAIAIGDSIVLTDSLRTGFTVVVGESFTLSDGALLGNAAIIGDALNFTDGVSAAYSAVIGESFTLTDAFNFDSGAPDITRSIADTMSMSDGIASSLAQGPALTANFSDVFALSDSSTLSFSYSQALSDTLTQSDDVLAGLGSVSPSTNVGVAPVLYGTFIYGQSAYGGGYSYSIGSGAALVSGLSDTLSFIDSFGFSLIGTALSVSLSDSLVATDSIAVFGANAFALSDSLSLTDGIASSVASGVGITLGLADSFSVTDQFTSAFAMGALAVALGESFSLTDQLNSVFGMGALASSLSDTLVVNDNIGFYGSGFTALGDSGSFSDALAYSLVVFDPSVVLTPQAGVTFSISDKSGGA